MRIKYLLTILLSFYFGLLSSQIKIRLFSDFTPDYAIFTVDSGEYQLSNGSGRSIIATKGDMLIISRYNGKIFVKKRYGESFTGDSIDFRGSTGEDYFALQINQPEAIKRSFTGDLKCFSDMGTLFLINTSDIDKYIAGVVMAEGGGRRNDEYFKTQAIIARTYTYKYLNRHILDKFNLCDDTHCQAFNGLTSDSLIINAVRSTSGLVITTSDSIPIMSAFHSNCGGETSPSEYAWVTGQTYLKKISDPYCQSSRSALWEKKISV
jgi:stage II sporulation protein D